MKRRALLVALAAGLSGCQGMVEGGSDGDGVDRQRNYGVPEGTPTGEAVLPTGSIDVPEGLARTVTTADGRNLSVLGAPGTDPGPGRVTAGFASPPTDRGPAELWVAVTNLADHGWTFRPEATAPLGGYLAEPRRPMSVNPNGGNTDDGPLLYLTPTDGRPRSRRDVRPDAPADGRWVATDSLSPLEGSAAREGIYLDSGESLVGRYALLRPPDRPFLPHQAIAVVGGDDVTLSLAAWNPLDVRVPSPLEDPLSVPPLPGTEETFWFHKYDDSVVVAPDRERLSLSGDAPRDATTLTLYNDSPVVLRQTGWNLYKHHDGDWKRVGPFTDFPGGRLTVSLNSVPPGGTRRYRFEATRSTDTGESVEWHGYAGDDEGPSEDPPENHEGEDEADDRARVGGLGGGLYAFGIENVSTPLRPRGPVEVEQEDRLVHSGGSAAVAALLVLDGDPVGVTPAPTVDAAERSGSVVEVTLSGPDRDESNGAASSTLVVERAESDSAIELLSEQVLQFETLRSAVAHFEAGVETVRVEGGHIQVRRPIVEFGAASGRVGPGEEVDELVFRHVGTGYRARVEDETRAPE